MLTAALRISIPIVIALVAPTLLAAGAAAPLDQALAVYRTGDHAIVNRTFASSRDFQRLRLADRRTLDDWLGTWQREKAAFVLEMTNAASRNAPAYTMPLLSAGQRYILRRPRLSTGAASDADDEFERLWHKIALGILQRRTFDFAAEAYVGALRTSRSSRGPGVWDDRFALAFAIAQEQRCWNERPLRTPADQQRCLREAASRLSSVAGETSGRVQDEARVRHAWVLIQLGQIPAAVRSLDGLSASDDRELTYWTSLLRGRVATALGHHGDAAHAYRIALAQYPDAQSAAIGLALSAFHLDQPVEADELASAVRTRSTTAVDPWTTYFSGDDRFVERWVAMLRRAVP